MRAFFLGALGFAVSAGCSSGDPASEATARTASAIQGGTDDTTHDFAVGIEVNLGDGTGLVCSGALLAPNLVATARHCVQELSSDTVVCGQTTFGSTYATSQFLVTTSPVIERGATLYTVGKIVVPTGSSEDYVCGNDIALLILTQNTALPQYVEPVLSPPMTDHDVWATSITAIGYGIDTPTDEAGVTAGTRRIKQDIPLECIPDDPAFVDCYADSSKKAAIAGDEFWAGDGTCEGDSGTGSYDQTQFNAGNWESFGVLVRGGVSSDGQTCVGSIYTRFDAWSGLLVSAATEASQRGGYALPAWVANAALDDAGFSDVDPAAGPNGGMDPPSTSTSGNGSKGGCAVSPRRGPTHPVPWRALGVGVALVVAASRRRRSRR